MYINNKLYIESIKVFASTNIDWEKLKNKSIIITGATGLIGTFLVDLLMCQNILFKDNITIYIISRSKEKVFLRFHEYFNFDFFNFIEQDIQEPIKLDKSVDYIIHCASDNHPIAFSTEPINIILTSVLGSRSVFDFASTHQVKRIVYLSSSEIYGINRGDVDSFKEDYCGYIDCNTVRSCYPEAKRTTESLCQAYIKENKLDIVIARCCHVYGPTFAINDSKVIFQFLKNAVAGNNLILKSKGDQQYSYCFVGDVCSALLTLLFAGKSGEAYNISDSNCKLSLLQIATILSEYSGTKVVYETPSLIESNGYSKATKALVDSTKLENLGWRPKYSIQDGLIRTIEIMRSMMEANGTENIN